MNASAVSFDAIQPPDAPTDHAALDAIMSRLEQRYGMDPRLARAFRLFMARRVELSEQEPTTALVHGESGNDYRATITGFCECPDAQNGHTCKHQLATKIAVQMKAVENANGAAVDVDATRAYLNQLCMERQRLGARIAASGNRPVDDATWREYGEWIEALRSKLPTVTLIR